MRQIDMCHSYIYLLNIVLNFDFILKTNIITAMSFRPNKQSKQHCQQDKACASCCPCCKKCNQNNQIRVNSLKQAIEKLKGQNSVMERINIQIKQKLQNLMKVHSKCGDMDLAEERLRSQLQKTMFAQQQTQIMILKSQSGQLKDQIQQLKKENERMIQRNDELQQIKDIIQSKLSQNQIMLQKYKEEVSELKFMKLKDQQIIQTLEQRCLIAQKLLQEKQEIVFKLQKCIHQAESYYDRQKSRVSDLTIHKIKNQRALKDKQNMLDALKSASEDQLRSLSTLQSHNGKLTEMVGFLKEQMYKHRLHEEVLVDRIHDTEDLAWDKTIKLQMIKNDVHNLKLSL